MKDAILIAGPTASGKSALALAIAKAFGGAVVNADSMQVYDGLRVITARPSSGEMEGVAHHLYGNVDPATAHSTGLWLTDMAECLDALRRREEVPVIVGGTGLYFEALTEGLSAMPAIPAAIRRHWRARLAEDGPNTLHAILRERDRETAGSLEPADGQRIVRALEVLEATGQSIRALQAGREPPLIDAARAEKIVLMPERGVVRERIDRRFDAMMEAGALDEVAALVDRRLAPDLPAMRAIGVPQLAAHLRGEITRDDAVAQAKAASRQYAKRQTTWFRNRFDGDWRLFETAAGAMAALRKENAL